MLNNCPLCQICQISVITEFNNQNIFNKLVSKKLNWHYFCEICNIFFSEDTTSYTKFFANGLFQIIYRCSSFRGDYIDIIKYYNNTMDIFPHNGKIMISLLSNKNYIFNFSDERFLKFIKSYELLQ